MSGYDNFVPKWALDGKMMIWGCDRDGTRQQGGELSSSDVYGMFFTKAAFDRFKLSKEELAVVKEQEDKDKKERTTRRKMKRKRKKLPLPNRHEDSAKVVIDWTNLTDRKARLTIHTSPASDWLLSKDGEKLFYLTSFEKETISG